MDDLYGGTNRYFRQVAAKLNLETTFVDATDASKVAAAIRPNTKMVWIETPTNPTLKVVDVRAVADIVKQHKVGQYYIYITNLITRRKFF